LVAGSNPASHHFNKFNKLTEAIMNIPNPTPPGQLRNKIAELQRDNRNYHDRVQVLLGIISGLSHSLNDAVDTIALHEHNDCALMILEADLGESLNVTTEQLNNL
jgi:hypothetical protein